MKLFALTINNSPIPLPPAVKNITTAGQGAFGQNVIQTAVAILMLFAVLAAFTFIVYAGFKFITSGGDKNAFANARKTIEYAVMGLVVVFLSILIVQIIAYFLNVPILTTK